MSSRAYLSAFAKAVLVTALSHKIGIFGWQLADCITENSLRSPTLTQAS